MPHAGETTGPQMIWDAINELGAERIGHGTLATQDRALLSYLVDNNIPLEVCPTFNLATGAVASLEQHPICDMVAAGVTVTVNSDDPPMFSTSRNHEFEAAARLLDLDEGGVADLAKAGVNASFMDSDAKQVLLAEIDVYAANAATHPLMS